MMDFFKGSTGKWSMMRFLCFFVVVTVVPFLYVHPDQATPACGLIGVALAGKWLQRRSER